MIPKCTKPDYVVENIFKVFDLQEIGTISLRELLMAISMSMKGEPKQKLHWAYKLYDKDGDNYPTYGGSVCKPLTLSRPNHNCGI